MKGFEIICDTCILLESVCKSEPRVLIDFCEELKKENKLCISEYTFFELFRGQTKERRGKYLALSADFKKFPVSADVLTKAAELVNDYKYCHLVDNAGENNKISPGDLIIGATAFVNEKTCILTKNQADFPRPFFQEICRKYLPYKDKNGKELHESYFLLEPDPYYEGLISKSRD